MNIIYCYPPRRRNRNAAKAKLTLRLALCASVICFLVPEWWMSSFQILPAVEASDSETISFPLPIAPQNDENIFDDEIALSSLFGELDTFVQNAISYLVRISHSAEQDPDFPGRFTYQADTRINLDKSLQNNYWKHHNQPDYNLLRHNGAIYALSQAYHRNEEQSKKSPKNPRTYVTQTVILKTMEKAVGYLRDNALLPVPNHKDDWIAAWERDDPDDPHSTPDTAKLGGAGLALIALGELEGIKPHSVSMEKELRKLGAFVESLQDKDTGSFTCKYKWGSGPSNKWVSLYYPGEAALGMVTLAELELQIEEEEAAKLRKMVTSTELEFEHQHLKRHFTPTKEKFSERWIKVAKNALLYLERLRRDQELDEIEPDHWALLATARLLPILDQQRKDKTDGSHGRKQADLDYWLIYNHGVKVANSIVADHTTEGLAEHKGCFSYDDRTCPTSTRIEGLLAAMTFIEESEMFFGTEGDSTEPLRNRIERDVGSAIRFLLRAQLKTDYNNMKGAIPGQVTTEKLDLPEYGEDEDFDFAEVRVDYVQHSMSAVMAYEAFLLDKMEKRHNQKAFHERVNEHVHKAVKHVKHKFDTATSSSVFVNYCILGAVCLLFGVVVCLAYLPSSWIPFLGRRSRRRRRVKRKD